MDVSLKALKIPDFDYLPNTDSAWTCVSGDEGVWHVIYFAPSHGTQSIFCKYNVISHCCERGQFMCSITVGENWIETKRRAFENRASFAFQMWQRITFRPQTPKNTNYGHFFCCKRDLMVKIFTCSRRFLWCSWQVKKEIDRISETKRDNNGNANYALFAVDTFTHKWRQRLLNTFVSFIDTCTTKKTKNYLSKHLSE